MNGNHPDSETINVSFSDGRVDPGAATKTVVGTLATCMLAVAAGGGALVGYGHYYTTEISGAGMGDGFFYVGGLLLGIGITGAVAAWLRQTWLMLLVEIVLLVSPGNRPLRSRLSAHELRRASQPERHWSGSHIHSYVDVYRGLQYCHDALVSDPTCAGRCVPAPQLMFCLLYGFTIVAILLATETHNPVAYGIEKAW
jgi:hypothetical protein